MAENGVIGVDGKMPWHLPADLRHFRQVTWGKPIIMGRKTHASLGRPLPGRTNIVVSGNPAYPAAGCLLVDSPARALAATDAAEVMVIGGAQLYQAFLPLAHRFHLTLIHRAFDGDTCFPAWDANDWVEVSHQRVENDPDSGLSYSLIVLERADSSLAGID